MEQDGLTGLFNVEYVFRTLYEAQDLDPAIQGVLELTANAFGFGQGDLFEIQPDGSARCTFLYHAQGTTPLPEKWPRLDQSQTAQRLHLFEANDTYLDRHERPIDPDKTPPAFRVLSCFRNAGNIRGFVEFSRTGNDDSFSEKHCNALCSIVRLLGVFLAGRVLNQELCESNLLLQSVVDGMHTCTYIIDPLSHIIKYINQNTRDLMPGAHPRRYCYEALRDRKIPCEDCPIDRMIREGTKSDCSEMYLEQFQTWARVNAALVTVPSGQTFGVFNSFDFSDHSREHGQDTDLSDFTHDTSLYDALSMSTDDYLIMCDMATKRFYFPQKMVDEFSLPAQVIVDAVPIWLDRIHKDDKADFLAEITLMFEGKSDTHTQEYRAKNWLGEWVWLRSKGHVERNKDGSPTLFAVVLSNLGKKSKVDHLTGLLDKYEFEVSIRARLSEGVSRGVLLLLGLDNFRYINNIYGWDFGDNVLKEASLRFLSTLPEHFQLYRLDGDKFGIFFHDTDLAEAEQYYQSLFHIFRQHRQFGEHRYYCTVSGGCAHFEAGESLTFGTLYKQAICALDAAKREGKNRLTVYDPKTMGQNERVLSMMAALHDSAEHDWKGFELYYQPQIDPVTHQILSTEALMRWKSDALGMVSPAEFIPLLEQTGLIQQVGRWVFWQATKACRKWRKSVPSFTVSINLSFAQLQDQSFLPYLTKQINAGHIDPRMLHLEITESCIVDGSRMLGGVIGKLREMGFIIEMDDFGTGYSSLEILKNAPTDVVKIDQAFVRGITHSKFDATFIQIIVDLCHSVGIRVCLEGVETQEEYHLVEPMNLDLIQGFLFGRPQPEQNFYENFILKQPLHQ